MVSLDLTLQFPTLHAYAVLLQEELGLAVEAGPDVPPLAGNAEPNQDPQLAADWLTWWRAILRKTPLSGNSRTPILAHYQTSPTH